MRLDPLLAAERLRKFCALRPTLALVLGSGFQHAIAGLRVAAEIPFARLPGFPRPSVNGHAGKVLFGHFGGVPVVVLSGRAHFYEGHAMEVVTFPMREIGRAHV